MPCTISSYGLESQHMPLPAQSVPAWSCSLFTDMNGAKGDRFGVDPESGNHVQPLIPSVFTQILCPLSQKGQARQPRAKSVPGCGIALDGLGQVTTAPLWPKRLVRPELWCFLRCCLLFLALPLLSVPWDAAKAVGWWKAMAAERSREGLAVEPSVSSQ